MSAVSLPVLKVRVRSPIHGMWNRRRAGLQFGKDAAELTAADLGEGLAALQRLGAICSDPHLVVLVVDGDEERAITDDEVAALTAAIEAEGARVDPDNPPAAVDGSIEPPAAPAQTASVDAAVDAAAPTHAPVRRAARKSGAADAAAD